MNEENDHPCANCGHFMLYHVSLNGECLYEMGHDEMCDCDGYEPDDD